MATKLESSLIFALLSKCSVLSQTNLAFSLLAVTIIWLAISLFLWTYPGGPAWGKYLFGRLISGSYKTGNVIPGPRGFPLVGSMSLMSSTLAHRRIADAAEKFGAKRLMAFSLGETRVIVTCNPDVAKEILNSPVFADRPVKESAYSLMFNRAIGFAPHGVYWRTLRRIASNHLFSTKQIRRAETQRRVISSQMVEFLEKQSSNEPCFVRELLKTASLNNMMCSVFGQEYELEKNHVELREMVEEGYDLLGTLNWTDHLPWLSEFDPQRIRSRCSTLVPKVNRFVSRIISEHRNQTGDLPRDFVDVLLSLHGSDKLSDPDIIAVLWEMIFRGTDTVAVLIEWILARMVLHPDMQSTVQNELDQVVGKSRAVDESDLASLPYLTAVVKEVLRLHPPGPLLSWARLAITDTIVDGRLVPAGTTAMVNMWAVSHDLHVWVDPLEFKPERFVAKEGEVEFSVLGSDLRLAPFGSGRRICPGKNLGFTTVMFWTATMLHEFEWGPSDGNGVDLSEKLRLSCEMANPLPAKLRRRRS
ncbi:putative flavonoid 3'-monooxygenase [Arabidopsis thaliana]